MAATLSATERQFIRDGVDVDLRSDGRGRLDARDFVLETGIVLQASGSARVVLDTTDVLVGIKAEFGEPDPAAPDLGRVECSVECAASASQEFEGRGGEDLNSELTSLLGQILSRATCLDLRSLCLIPRLQCWVLHVDALVLDVGGNVVDAIMLACRAALADLRLPNVKVDASDPQNPSVEVSDDPMDTRPLDIARVPLTVTLYKVGAHSIVDPTPEEEACADASLVLAVNKAGACCLAHKRGRGGIDPRLLVDMIKVGKKIALTLLDKLDRALAIEAASTQPKVGFFANKH